MHNINSMAWTGEKPWHGLGKEVAGAMTSAEAIKAAGLDWAVEKRPVYFFEQRGMTHPITDKFATVRTDTMVPLGIVGNQYRVLQNKEAFSFFDAIVGERLACFHTAGALGQGERIWMLAKLPGECWITPKDAVEKFLLLTNSHDGYNSVNILATPIRVVCQNTLNVALNQIGSEQQRSRVRHTVNMGQGIEGIRKQIGIADNYFRTFEEMSKMLVSKKATTAIVEQLFTDLGLSKEKSKTSTRTGNIRYDILKQFESGRGNGLPGVKGTAWALFNGVTEYVDYFRSTRGDTSEKAESRANSLLFGSGADMKQKALDSLLVSVK